MNGASNPLRSSNQTFPEILSRAKLGHSLTY